MTRKLGPPPKAKSQAVTNSMKANKAKNTGPEIKVRKILRDEGIIGYRLNYKKVPGRPDIAFPKRKIAVFVNGCYWHRCPYCKLPLPKSNKAFWRKKFGLNKERDTRKKRELKKLGWQVFTIWECRLKPKKQRSLASVVSDIGAAYCSS